MLELKNLYKTLGDFKLQDINLEIKDGEYFVILGPTGTGKTVILEIIAGMYHPDQGNLFYNSRNYDKLLPEERKVGFVYQDFALFPHLNVKKNIEFGIHTEIRGEIKERLNSLIKLLNIAHLLDRYPSTLSGGEQQRVAIARALVTEPEILLLDEPLSSLDPQTKENLQRELIKIHESLKTTTLHITHDFKEALFLADRIAVMHNGRIIQVGTPKEIFSSPESVFVANFVGMENIFQGKLDDKKVILDNGLEIDVVIKSRINENVYIAIRPENILLSKKRLKSSARNVFKGKLLHVMDQGALYKLTIDIGVLINVFITNQSYNEMNYKIGDETWVTFKASAVHVF